MKAAPTPLLSNAVLRTDSESKPRCPEKTEVQPILTSPTYNIASENKPRCPASNSNQNTKVVPTMLWSNSSESRPDALA